MPPIGTALIDAHGAVPMQLLVATRNPHKLREIRAILAAAPLRIVGLPDGPGVPVVEEDGITFEANAVKKAVILALHTGGWTLADDSGLEVAALGGAPGVRSARYAGEPADYQANNEKLLRALSATDDRRACFRCAIALSSPTGQAQIVEGRCDGRITRELRGQNGFGYDPLFVPDGHAKTFAEMDPSLKNRISHRAAALRRAREEWGAMLQSEPEDWTEATVIVRS